MDQPSTPPPLVIRAARVIDPASGMDGTADVLVIDGCVAGIGSGAGGGLDAPSEALEINAEGLIACPGLIDPHVHLREPGQEHKETIATGTAAAVAGGFTTVCCMPNTAPAIDSPEVVRAVRHIAEETAACRVFPVAAGTVGRRGDEPTEVDLLVRAGAVGISDDGDMIANAGMMAAVLEMVGEAGTVFMQHCQEPSLTYGAAMHGGDVSTRLGLGGWPRVAEEIIIERDIRLVAAGGGTARYHVQHMSSGGSVDLIKRARERGLPVTAEASPHHLLLTCEIIETGHQPGMSMGGPAFDTAAKMNPPLRERSDIEALRQAVADGVVTVLATDHAPHTPDEKNVPFAEAPFGIIGLETALAGYAEALLHTGAIGWPRFIELLTVEPAKLCGLDARGLGRLAVGGPGDVTLIDPSHAWTVAEDDLAGKSRNTPFLGTAFRSRAVATIAAGRLAWSLETAMAGR